MWFELYECIYVFMHRYIVVSQLAFLPLTLLQTQGLNPGLPHCRQILYQLSHKGNPRTLKWVAYPFSSRSSWHRIWTGVYCIAGGFFTNWAMREALKFWTLFWILHFVHVLHPADHWLKTPGYYSGGWHFHHHHLDPLVLIMAAPVAVGDESLWSTALLFRISYVCFAVHLREISSQFTGNLTHKRKEDLMWACFFVSLWSSFYDEFLIHEKRLTVRCYFTPPRVAIIIF